MTQNRRSLSAEFKHDAACLVLDQGYSITEAYRSLDVGETTLRRWVDQLRAERTGQTPNTKALTPEQQEIQALKARVQRHDRLRPIPKHTFQMLCVYQYEESKVLWDGMPLGSAGEESEPLFFDIPESSLSAP